MAGPALLGLFGSIATSSSPPPRVLPGVPDGNGLTRPGRRQAARGATLPEGMIAERLNAALNAHDIDAFVALFAPDYDSWQPAHPDRAFVGAEQVRANWTEIFAGVPDFRAELSGDGRRRHQWSEWHWTGTGLEMAGVTVMRRPRRPRRVGAPLRRARRAGDGIEAAVREMTGD